jgi:hypothetical protein
LVSGESGESDLSELAGALNALDYGGAMVYPLLAPGLLATVIIIDRAIVFPRFFRDLVKLAETFGFSWRELDRELSKLPAGTAYCRFPRAIAENRSKPRGWVELRAGDEPAD